MSLFLYFRSPDRVKARGESPLRPHAAAPENPQREHSRSDSAEPPLPKLPLPKEAEEYVPPEAGRGLVPGDAPEFPALSDRLVKERSARQDFIEESTLHFKVVFDGYEHGGISRKILGILEDAYKQVGNDLDYYPDGPVTVVLYTEEDFRDTTRAPEWAGGIYDGTIRVPVKGVEGREEEVRRVLFHEYVHAVVHSILGSTVRSLPLWINEGLAEYYSARYARRTGQSIPLSSLEGSFDRLQEKANIAYLVSYSAVASLMDTYRAYRMRDFLFSCAKGHGVNKAFTESFSMTYNEFVSTWGKD